MLQLVNFYKTFQNVEQGLDRILCQVNKPEPRITNCSYKENLNYKLQLQSLTSNYKNEDTMGTNLGFVSPKTLSNSEKSEICLLLKDANKQAGECSDRIYGKSRKFLLTIL